MPPMGKEGLEEIHRMTTAPLDRTCREPAGSEAGTGRREETNSRLFLFVATDNRRWFKNQKFAQFFFVDFEREER